MEMSCAAASMPQSDRPDLLSSVEFGVLMPQSNSPVLFFFFFSFCYLVMAFQGRNLVFFCYINRNALIECRSFKKTS